MYRLRVTLRNGKTEPVAAVYRTLADAFTATLDLEARLNGRFTTLGAANPIGIDVVEDGAIVISLALLPRSFERSD